MGHEVPPHFRTCHPCPTLPHLCRSSLLDLLKSARDGEKLLAAKLTAASQASEAAKAARATSASDLAAYFAALAAALESQRVAMERALAQEQDKSLRVCDWLGGWWR
jgi:hypothetical protein